MSNSTADKYDWLAAAAIGGILLLSGLGILGLQVLDFLSSGTWRAFTLIDLASVFTSNSWLWKPEKWLGVHKILSFIPAAATLIIVGYFMLIAAFD